MSRKDDEHLYQPAIHSRWIRELYRMAQKTGLPMTVLVDDAMRRCCAAYAESAELETGPRETAMRFRDCDCCVVAEVHPTLLGDL